MQMSVAGWSCWMFYIVCILLAYIHSVHAGCEEYRIRQAAKNQTKDWGPDDEYSGSFEEFTYGDEGDGNHGDHQAGGLVGGSSDNGPYGALDFTETRGRCKQEGGRCMTKGDYCRGSRTLYQTQCANECVCCLPERVLDYSGHKLVLIKRKKSWKCSRDICRDKGGDLYVPTSVEAMIRFLRDKQLYKKKVWLGINDFKRARTYEGVHGNKLTGGWMRDQPTRKDPGEDCVAVEDFSRKFKGLRVRPCVETYFFVCDLGNNHDSDHDVGV